jgi:hypothetical protein
MPAHSLHGRLEVIVNVLVQREMENWRRVVNYSKQ